MFLLAIDFVNSTTLKTLAVALTHTSLPSLFPQVRLKTLKTIKPDVTTITIQFRSHPFRKIGTSFLASTTRSTILPDAIVFSRTLFMVAFLTNTTEIIAVEEGRYAGQSIVVVFGLQQGNHFRGAIIVSIFKKNLTFHALDHNQLLLRPQIGLKFLEFLPSTGTFGHAGLLM